MNARRGAAWLITLLLLSGGWVRASEPAAPAPAANAAAEAPPSPEAPAPAKSAPPAAAESKPTADAQAAPKPDADAKAAAVSELPPYQVSADRITELDIKIQKLAKEIAREQKHLKPSDLDDTMNNEKVTKPFRIFGGQSAEQRESVARERVSLMQAEQSLLESMKHATSQAEADELQQQVYDLQRTRRNLDEVLR